ncbi:putative Protein N-acetyltransferase, RimJ/RimL family [Blattamonas nauphoetae]|uniref:N-acetyltransferase domain-containing protein n=1 Tax=Blattamonas nauphoetae TaxID=2049346 RepID=A0ABQ9XK91_9EUKA|nr:putative Protein N-acetyltransferase, RimJ/RimL family [Blattamonas nauphoetae]
MESVLSSFFLQDDDISLRVFRTSDREQLVALADNPKIFAQMSNRFPHPFTSADADFWISRDLKQVQPNSLAIEWKGQLCGGIRISPYSDVHSKTGGMGYWLGEPFWGKGIMARAISLFVPFAFREFSLLRVEALVFANNTSSARVLEKAGFQKEGVLRKHCVKNGIIMDGILFAKVVSD